MSPEHQHHTDQNVGCEHMDPPVVEILAPKPEPLLAAETLDDETPDEEPLDDESLENGTPQWQEQQPLSKPLLMSDKMRGGVRLNQRKKATTGAPRAAALDSQKVPQVNSLFQQRRQC